MSDPSISDIDFKIKMFGSELSIISNIFKFLIFKTLDLSPSRISISDSFYVGYAYFRH